MGSIWAVTVKKLDWSPKQDEHKMNSNKLKILTKRNKINMKLIWTQYWARSKKYVGSTKSWNGLDPMIQVDQNLKNANTQINKI